MVRMTASTSITSSVTGYQIDRQTTTPRKYFWGHDLNLYVLLWQHRAVRSQSETLVIETRAKVPPGGSSLWNVFNGLTWISCSAEPVQRATEKTELEDIDFSLRWSMQKFWKRWMSFFESCLEEWKKRASLLSVAGLHSSPRTNVSVSYEVLMGFTFFCMIDKSRIKEYVNCILIRHSNIQSLLHYWVSSSSLRPSGQPPTCHPAYLLWNVREITESKISKKVIFFLLEN